MQKSTLSNKEILTKAIGKAEKNGYYSWASTTEFEDIDEKEVYGIIFSHDFAKAFWGEEEVCTRCDWVVIDEELETDGVACFCPECIEGASTYDDNLGDSEFEPAYLYHLQQMVKEEGPLKYLGKFI